MANDHAKHKIFPSYHAVAEAKAESYPDGIKITDTSAEVPLQSLLEHTVQRLVMGLSLTAAQVHSCQNRAPVLQCKWGFDGARGQTLYKQSFAAGHSGEACEESLFSTTLVPLQLSLGDEVIWRNLKPSSTRLCRPIRIRYVKETAEVSCGERQHVEDQIQQLQPAAVNTSSGAAISVKYDMRLTMLDGRAVNALTETRCSASCPVCGARPSQMNDLSAVRNLQARQEALDLGLSPLHARIRFFECVLHIAYRLDTKTWAVVGDERKAAVKRRKQEIQDQFRQQTGLTVDCVRSGTGTTNDGNTARRAFADPAALSRITGVSQQLIERFAAVLAAINSYDEIDPAKFD